MIDKEKGNRYSNLRQLESQSGEGWTVGTDRYGDVTYVKVMAGSAKEIVAGR